MLTRRGGAVALALVVAACSSSDPEATPTTPAEPVGTDSTTTTTAPERPASTTTTGYDPASIEGQVEAAYLRSWDVYAEAVYNLQLDEEALAEVYAGEGLINVRTEIDGRIGDGRAALAKVDHMYRIAVTDDTTASVLDELTNHQVLIDAKTKDPIEVEPNQVQVLNFVMNRIGGQWRVVLIQKVSA